MTHMRTEQAQPNLIDRRMRYAWKADGSKNLTARAKEKAREILANYQPTPVKEDIRQKVEEIVKEAEAELLPKNDIIINKDEIYCGIGWAAYAAIFQ